MPQLQEDIQSFGHRYETRVQSCKVFGEKEKKIVRLRLIIVKVPGLFLKPPYCGKVVGVLPCLFVENAFFIDSVDAHAARGVDYLTVVQ